MARNGSWYRLIVYSAIALLVLAMIFLFIILITQYMQIVEGESHKATPPSGDAIGILDEVAAEANPNAEWIAGYAKCTNGYVGPACNMQST